MAQRAPRLGPGAAQVAEDLGEAVGPEDPEEGIKCFGVALKAEVQEDPEGLRIFIPSGQESISVAHPYFLPRGLAPPRSRDA